ncbi:MAG: thioredoxin [Bacteroidetes bacterium]|nr:thioredoxin [Bacteroidota bacterium]
MKKRTIYIAVLVILAAGVTVFFSFTKKDDTGKTGLSTIFNKNDNNKGKMEHLTVETFKKKVFDYDKNKEWKYEGELPAIIDFYADWCGPCKMVAPVLEELSGEYDGKVIIYKVDTEAEQELAAVFGIRSIPSILFIPKNGQPQMSMGAMPKEGFIQAINDVLLNSKN